MDLDGIAYIAASISNMAIVPVRLYEGSELAFRNMPIELEVDPIEPHLEEILTLKDSVSYLITEDYFYYGIVNSDTLKLVIGPLRETHADDLAYRHLGIALSIPPERIEQFVASMRGITPMPLHMGLQMLCVMNYVMNGERLNFNDLVVHDDTQDTITRQLAEERFQDNQFRDAFEQKHASEQVELMLTDFIKQGQVDELKEFLSHMPTFKVGTLSPDRLRHEKNSFIAGITLMSRAAIAGGVNADDALTLSDSYINRCELLSTPDQIYELYYHMVIQYAEMVQRVRVGDEPSALVISVADYVRRHIFEPIKTEDVANAMFVSRGFLSTKFKQETGQSLADFIQNEKIEEAKRLLTRTDQPLLAISTYLGFSSQSHFNTVFKKRTGMTPKEYRSKRM